MQKKPGKGKWGISGRGKAWSLFLPREFRKQGEKRALEKKINFYGKVIDALDKPEIKETFAKGEVPEKLKPLSYHGSLASLISELKPMEEVLRAGIYLPKLDLREKTNYLLYVCYWYGGMYFVPVHATVKFSKDKLLDLRKRAPELRAGKIIKARMKKAKIRGQFELPAETPEQIDKNVRHIEKIISVLKWQNERWKNRLKQPG